jgi:hypothetical protein
MNPTRLALAATTGALVLALSACAGNAGADVVRDAGSTATPSASSTLTLTPADPTPTAPAEEPKPGALPDFPYADYAYTLGMQCFCATFDQRYRITVAGGQVTDVAWATTGDGHQAGDEVSNASYLRITIQDIVDKGNAPGMAKVKVVWPAGQLYPDSVYVDKMANVADEEITYLVSDVVPA